MCGLAGAFSWTDSAPAPRSEQVAAACHRMWRRGQDGDGQWISDNRRTVLGYRRLAILDPQPRSGQPMRRGQLVLVFNGEIYNFRDLRRELEQSGETFVTEGDAEVILALYARHGPACVERLRGMFAFAIADERAGSLFLARDHFGMKPLYYAIEGGTLYFASQVKALQAFAKLSADPDPAGLVGFHLMGSVPEPFTIYRSMRCLQAGHHLTVDRDGPGEPVRFAHVAAALAQAEPDDDGDLCERVAAAMRDSMAAHLVSDVEVGLLLSAGIDSGGILGLMHDQGASRVRCFTLEFPELAGSREDEAPLAREIARRYGARHEVESIDNAEFDDCAERIFEDMDQPTVDGINSWFACRMAGRAGLKVVLSGAGGDELLGGYPYFERVPRMHRAVRRLASLPLAGRLARWAARSFGPVAARRNPKLAGLFDCAASLPGAYLLSRSILLPFELEDVLDEGLVRDGLDRLRPLERIAGSIEPDPGSDGGRMIALETSNYLRNQLLRDGDWASMAHTVELRTPFVDWPTLQAIAPVAHRLGGRAGKLAFAAAPSNPLPAATVARARSGFTVPLSAWMGRGAGFDRLTSRRWAPQVAARYLAGSHG